MPKKILIWGGSVKAMLALELFNLKDVIIFDPYIKKLKITSVNRNKMIQHLDSLGLNISTLQKYDNHFRMNNSYGKNEITELDKYSEGLIYFSEQLVEKPINIQLRLEYLIQSEVAKKFHYV